MDNQLNTYGFGASGTAGALAVRNRVLRNTYWLLALSMIPTILGAWIGVATGFNLMGRNPLMGFVIFMAVAFGFFYAIERFKNSSLGVALLLGFTFFMGLMLSRLIAVPPNAVMMSDAPFEKPRSASAISRAWVNGCSWACWC